MMSDRSEATLVPVATEPVPFWRSVGQALRGEHHDYTAERLPRAVLLLAVPMVLEMVMESLFAIADVFWVSRLGKDAVAVIGITESLMTLIYAVAIGISIAATAIVSRRIGREGSRTRGARGGTNRAARCLCFRGTRPFAWWLRAANPARDGNRGSHRDARCGFRAGHARWQRHRVPHFPDQRGFPRRW
jgi:hypothetical protein